MGRKVESYAFRMGRICYRQRGLTNIRSFRILGCIIIQHMGGSSAQGLRGRLSFVIAFCFLSSLLVVCSGVLGGRFSLSFSGGQHFGRRLTTVLQANSMKGGSISCFVRFSYDNVLIGAQIIPNISTVVSINFHVSRGTIRPQTMGRCEGVYLRWPREPSVRLAR